MTVLRPKRGLGACGNATGGCGRLGHVDASNLAPRVSCRPFISRHGEDISHDMQPGPATNDYVDRIVNPTRQYGFPDWYMARLESFRP